MYFGTYAYKTIVKSGDSGPQNKELVFKTANGVERPGALLPPLKHKHAAYRTA